MCQEFENDLSYRRITSGYRRKYIFLLIHVDIS